MIDAACKSMLQKTAISSGIVIEGINIGHIN